MDRLQREHGRVIITRHGHAAAVVMSVEDLESLEETLDIGHDFAIAWTATARRALVKLPEKAATAVVEFLYGSRLVTVIAIEHRSDVYRPRQL